MSGYATNQASRRKKSSIWYCRHMIGESSRSQLEKRIAVILSATAALIVALLVVLVLCEYFFLEQPSRRGECGGRTMGSPEPPRHHLVRFRGEVVGENIWLGQYRWLRRKFKAVGTTISLVRVLPSTKYQGNEVRHGERVGDAVIDKSGRFDFGDLTPGEYDITVTYPGEDAVGFGFVIDPSARSTSVLIDASPAYYCNCCGWNFEPR